MGNKIKIAYITKNLVINGITNVVINYSIALDKEIFDVTIISGSPIADEIRNECNKFNISLVELPDKIEKTKYYYLSLWENLKKSKYDIIHVHGNSATIALELLLAKLSGCKIRIAHCHNSTCDNVRVHKLLYPIFKHLYTLGFACSKEAGDWLFKNGNYQILPNAFVTKKFVFDDRKRSKIREELNVKDGYVLLAVGRLNDQKNYPYLLKIFEKVAEKKKDVWLVIVGGGPYLDIIEELITKHPYRNRIIYYGETTHVEELYSAADVFVLPSKFEGLGIVFIEAQISGLPVITSDNVPKEVNIANRIDFLSLNDTAEDWANAILNAKQVNRDEFYSLHKKDFEIYDIKNNAKHLSEIYLKMIGDR